MQSSLPPGDHFYSEILEGLNARRYDFARVRTLSGHDVPVIGVSAEQMQVLRKIVTRVGLKVVLFGSRVAGTRLHQRTLHPVLALGLTMESTARHPSIGRKGVHNVKIRKDVIKEYGRDHPLTSDLSIAVIHGEQNPGQSANDKALDLETAFNRDIDVSFVLRVYLTIYGHTFREVRDFIEFGRVRYIKKDLPNGHCFSDSEIDEAFERTIVVVEPEGA